eukprot:gene7375-8594_t
MSSSSYIYAILDDLVKLCIRTFYTDDHIVVIDALLREKKRCKDDYLAQKLRLPTKVCRKVLMDLKADSLLKSHEVKTEATGKPGDRASTHLLWYLEYNHVIDIIKFKLYKMRLMMDADKNKKTDVQHYKCSVCSKTFSAYDIPKLLTMEGTLECDLCNGPLIDENPGTAKSLDALPTDLSQLKKLVDQLRKTDGLQIPIFARDMAEEDQGAFTQSAGAATTGERKWMDPSAQNIEFLVEIYQSDNIDTAVPTTNSVKKIDQKTNSAGRPMHSECGYIRVPPGDVIELAIVQPSGVADIYTGSLIGPQSLEFKLKDIIRTPSATSPHVVDAIRRFSLDPEDNNKLIISFDMATNRTPITRHLDTTASSSNNTSSFAATAEGTYIFWYWKESEIKWNAFTNTENDAIESFYVKDPKSATDLKISDKITVKFSDMTFYNDTVKTTPVRRSEMTAVWSWEKSRGEWSAFDHEVSKKIEVAQRKGQSKVSIDTERFINLSTFEQVRFDDEAKTRRVARCFSDISSLISPTWYFVSNGAWEMFADTIDIESRYQGYLKKGKSVTMTTASGDKIRFTTMTMESGTNVLVKRDNGPIQPLKKSYSQLSEDEKKALITSLLAAGSNAIAAKPTAPPTSTKKQRTDNQLYLPGEEDIISKGGKPMKYILKPSRHISDNSVDQMHFRIAESQFYRLLESSSTNYKVSKVEYVVNPKLIKDFAKKKQQYEDLKYDDCSPVFGFHGTSAKNINSICTNNFSVPGNNGVGHATDSGWYGKGIYFSEYPEYSIGYISDCSKLLLCKVLLGKSYKCSGLITGQPCKTGYTSHISPDEKELVIFSPEQILPLYIVHYGDGASDPDDDMGSVRQKALQMGSSNALAGAKICLSGTLKGGVTHVVTTLDDFTNKTSKISSALGSNVPVVSEKWLYTSIVKHQLCQTADFSFTAVKQDKNKQQEIKAVPLEDSDLLSSSLSSSSSFSSNGAAIDASIPSKPMCKYGNSCYRKNADHMKSFSHPFLID